MKKLLALALLALGTSTVAIQSAQASDRVVVVRTNRYHRHYYRRPAHRIVVIEHHR